MLTEITLVGEVTGAVTKQPFEVDRVPMRVFAEGLATTETVDIFMWTGTAWVAAKNAAGTALAQLITSGVKNEVIDVPGKYAIDKSATAAAVGVFGHRAR